MHSIDDFFTYLGIVLVIVNTVLFISSYARHRKDLPYRIICLYLISSLFTNIAVVTLASYRINNLYLSHYYFISQFILLSLFYRALFKHRQKRLVDVLLVLVLSILGLQYLISPELYYQFNTTEVFVTCLPLVAYSIIHLYNSLISSPKFMYLNSGILVYLATSTLIFILGDYLSGITESTAVDNIWFINKVLYVIYLSLTLAEWWNNFRRPKNR